MTKLTDGGTQTYTTVTFTQDGKPIPPGVCTISFVQKEAEDKNAFFKAICQKKLQERRLIKKRLRKKTLLIRAYCAAKHKRT